MIAIAIIALVAIGLRSAKGQRWMIVEAIKKEPLGLFLGMT